MSKRVEGRYHRQEKTLVPNLVSTALGFLGALSITSRRIRNYDGGLTPFGREISLETGTEAALQLGDGHTINLKNTTGNKLTFFPDAIKRVLKDQCPQLPIPQVDVDISDASSLLLGEKLYGDNNIAKGYAGMTEETKKDGIVIDKNVFIAEGGFEELQRIFGESYPLSGGFWAGKGVRVSPLEDLNGTFIHELKGHVCLGLDEEGAFNLQNNYVSTEGAPFFIKPDALKPNYLYADAVITGLGIFLLAQLAIHRVFKRN